mmetsp:Transcript_22813/g.50032  ORF Transcript_22813/g.50032 Transcript_22813/m.50032 type:complete len:219 (-) Transcript_22813:318-974(-)|eukprot:CAMPEP_0118945740 /NCGR_PEP_ID=MMETSP1169-20130426/42859_1 /TAXON_ID=36882 /ORGANISM="Pyramimonas obovata, Strain CCMP722" /LENGTH=218 /DNA_ID=CAMNT_0006891523 /DNA_START=86 /DNA_END=742 /DNA_ORIENTATION=-
MEAEYASSGAAGRLLANEKNMGFFKGDSSVDLTKLEKIEKADIMGGAETTGRAALPTVEELKERFSLQDHPEGGFYAETYRAESTVAASYGERNSSTAIYFLITPNCVSRLHRIQADEVWHFYLGEPMTVLEIDPATGALTKTTLGADVLSGQKVQHVVRAGVWFGAFPQPGTAYSFVGCTVAPGFDFADFELASRAKMVADFPQHEAEIRKLTEGLP